MFTRERPGIGAIYLGNGRCSFRVWSPLAQGIEVHLWTPQERFLPMERDERGYFQAFGEKVEPGTQYVYRFNRQKERPDPASRYQPQGIHGPSQVVDPSFPWETPSWSGFPLHDYIIYELHVGTFTPEGTFEAIIPYLAELRDLGITAVELMPVAQFPGARNWGYDGTYPFAVQNSYGGPPGLKKLVDACHRQGLSVILDVVYNHLGPEGNYLRDFGPYFTDRYKTPWGEAVNFDGPYSGEVRRFFIENALYWVTEFHMDALRIDAVHAILDFSAQPFLEELAQAVHQEAGRLSRKIHLIAESDLNDTRLVRQRELGGFGLDAQWNEDFHHALHALLTHERSGYYQDFGQLDQLVKALREGFVYSGQYSSYRRRRHGHSSRDIPAGNFVVFAQNHDQVGNRMVGDRLSDRLSFAELKLTAGVVVLSPFIPLLFMGEEYGERAPFQYFISHFDRDLIEAVRRGRGEEFKAFEWKGELPDPQDEATFLRSKLRHELRYQGGHRVLGEFYKELIRLRKTVAALSLLNKEQIEVLGYEEEKILFIRRWIAKEEVSVIFNFDDSPKSVILPLPAGEWRKQLDSEEECWGGQGSFIPVRLQSGGQMPISLAGKAFILLVQGAEEA